MAGAPAGRGVTHGHEQRFLEPGKDPQEKRKVTSECGGMAERA